MKQDDETKQPVLLANTEFKVYDLDAKKYVEQVTTYPNTVVHKSYFTDENGYLILPESLKCGNYRIEEVSAPDGYTQNTQYVEIKVDKNTAYQMDSVSGDAIITVTYENHPVKGKLVIHKSGETLKSFKKDFVYEETSLEGAEFEIYAAEDIFTPDHQVDEQGNRHVIYAKDTLVKTVTTDKPHMVEKLPVGEYTLREEQAPDGYLIAEDVKFTVKDTGKVQKVKMKDAHPYGKLVIKKTDSTSKAALPGAEFELREKESGKVVEKLVTDKTGTATSGKIPIATYKNGKVEKTVEYILVETKAPNGYELSSKKEEIRFEYKDGKTKVIEIVKEIKNTKSPSGGTPTGNSPKTGDSTNIWLPILLAVLSACGIGGVIWYKKKKGN